MQTFQPKRREHPGASVSSNRSGPAKWAPETSERQDATHVAGSRDLRTDIATLQRFAGNQAVSQMLGERHGQESAATLDGKLPPVVQAKMERVLGADFSDVVIHRNSAKATAVGALAYTQQNAVHFAPGQYNPFSSAGQRMIGHELGHVIQQRKGPVKPTLEVGGLAVNDDAHLEADADRAGARAASATNVATSHTGAPVQRMAATGTQAHGSVIQRLPTPEQVKKQLGDPKKDIKNPIANTWLGKKTGMKENLKENSTRYRDFLDILDRFKNYMDTTDLARTAAGMKGQWSVVWGLYSNAENFAREYVSGKDDGNKKEYMKQFSSDLVRERVSAQQKVNRFMIMPPLVPPKWWILTTGITLNDQPVQVSDAMNTGQTASGNLSTVKFQQGASGAEGVFKPTKEKIELGPEPAKPDVTASQAEKAEYTKKSKEHEAAATEDWLADEFGMNKQNTKMAERNVALARLDALLGAGVIAQAEMALYQEGNVTAKGSWMTKAEGKSAGSLVRAGWKDDSDQNNVLQLANDDANLQRLLSRLQLIDILAVQADRHAGNYFLDYGADGRITGLTGIDNDLTFGTKQTIDKKRQEYPGLSKFVDEELAERIIALQESDLRWAMSGLLNPEELEGLAGRLVLLQNYLKQLKAEGKLLKPGQWNQVQALSLRTEGKDSGNQNGNYYERLF